MTEPFLSLDLPDESATARLAEDIALALAPRDVVALHGDLGAGKTTLARALIRALSADAALEVPSPTFTLVQTYETARGTIAHFDLYRLAASDLDEIGFADAGETGIVLVEWPDRAGDALPAARLDVELAMAGTGRRAALAGVAPWPERFGRSRALRAFLDKSGWTDATRSPLAGDASSRRYERIRGARGRAVLMDWPARGMLAAGDARANFRAHDIGAFLAVDAALFGAGLSVPEIFAADRAAGFVLMEDFGTEGVVHDDAPVAERYRAAVEALAALHAAPRPPTLAIPGGGTHTLMRLDATVLGADLSLFLDDYFPVVVGRSADAATRAAFADAWRPLVARLAAAEVSWVLFDVQSANLFWLPGRSGIARVGLIDFQDMFVGPAAYDVATLAEDARVTVPAVLRAELKAAYAAARARQGPFDRDAFEAVYAIAAVARNLKNLGVFARLAATGRPQYLRHFPRLREYLAENLAHPVLSGLRLWYEKLDPA